MHFNASATPREVTGWKKLQAQVEELQGKETLLKAKLHPWLEEACMLTLPLQEKLKVLQKTQRTMCLVV